MAASSRVRTRDGTKRGRERAVPDRWRSEHSSIVAYSCTSQDGDNASWERVLQQFREAFNLDLAHLSTEAGAPVVAPALVIHLRVGALVGFFDQSGCEHPFDRPVHRSRPDLHGPIAHRLDIAHD